MPKLPFDIDLALSLVREAVKPFPKAAMFALADDGYTSLFQQLVACILSIRTLDEVSLVAARRLFARASDPQAIASLSPAEIDGVVGTVTFHERKATQIYKIAQRTVQEFNGVLPCDESVLLSFHGVGIKCAHLALGIACELPEISVDVHVHRVTHRWGYVSTRTPEETTQVLEEILPTKYWIEINSLLVPFGKHICTSRLPHCSTCPILAMCRQVGVTSHR